MSIQYYTLHLITLIIGTITLFAFSLLNISCTQSSDFHSVKFICITSSSIRGQQVFLTGNIPQMGSWNPGALRMNRVADSVWTLTLSIPTGENVEYKFTGGSWWMEALGPNDLIYENFELKVQSDTMLTNQVYGWLNGMKNGRPVLTPRRFQPQSQTFSIDGLWKYHSGDSAVWSNTDYNDTNWVITDSYINWTTPNDPKWMGIGWFRFHFYADSSLWNRTLAMRINQMGASEIYYNGKLLYSFGKVGASKSATVSNATSLWQGFRIDPTFDQIIAVRYANYSGPELQRLGFLPGFLISIRDLNTAFQTAVIVREETTKQMLFTIIPLILFFLHFSLWGFFRKQKQNLYYAMCMLGFAGITYFSYERNVVANVGSILLLTKLNSISVPVAIFFGLLTIYEMNYFTFPKRFWIFFSIFTGLCATSIIGYSGSLTSGLNYVFYLLTFMEIIYTAIQRSTKHSYGGWIVFTGALVLSVFIFLQIFIDYAIVPNIFGTNQVFTYGVVAFAISMSIYLSYNFAHVNEDLELQLVAVQQLSANAIDQERTNSRLELERKAIEFENERKSRELDSARDLQLSLLPKILPQPEGFEIAAMMKTATEVGGDYFDFFQSKNELLAVIGDATGHGLKAGNLVTATKALLNILSNSPTTKDILIAANTAIKQMNLRGLMMCLAVVRISGKSISYSSAGMPPVLIYRAKSKKCDTLTLKALPLGAVRSFPYKNKRFSLRSGDVAIFYSDGLSEIFNDKKEMYEQERIFESLCRHAEKTAEDIVKNLIADGDAWRGESPLTDDLTIVAIKKTKD